MASESAYVPNGLLSRLVGARLFLIEFVMDYVQLRFDGPSDDRPVLTCDVMPAVERDGRLVRPGELGYADALVALVTGEVVRTTEATGVGVRIELPTGAIVIHPERDEVLGPEIALLDGFVDMQWMCWRPGETSFEDLA